MKKILTVLLTLCVLLTLFTGCGDEAASGDSRNGSAADGVRALKTLDKVQAKSGDFQQIDADFAMDMNMKIDMGGLANTLGEEVPGLDLGNLSMNMKFDGNMKIIGESDDIKEFLFKGKMTVTGLGQNQKQDIVMFKGSDGSFYTVTDGQTMLMDAQSTASFTGMSSSFGNVGDIEEKYVKDTKITEMEDGSTKYEITVDGKALSYEVAEAMVGQLSKDQSVDVEIEDVTYTFILDKNEMPKSVDMLMKMKMDMNMSGMNMKADVDLDFSLNVNSYENVKIDISDYENGAELNITAGRDDDDNGGGSIFGNGGGVFGGVNVPVDDDDDTSSSSSDITGKYELVELTENGKTLTAAQAAAAGFTSSFELKADGKCIWTEKGQTYNFTYTVTGNKIEITDVFSGKIDGKVITITSNGNTYVYERV